MDSRVSKLDSIIPLFTLRFSIYHVLFQVFSLSLSLTFGIQNLITCVLFSFWFAANEQQHQAANHFLTIQKQSQLVRVWLNCGLCSDWAAHIYFPHQFGLQHHHNRLSIHRQQLKWFLWLKIWNEKKNRPKLFNLENQMKYKTTTNRWVHQLHAIIVHFFFRRSVVRFCLCEVPVYFNFSLLLWLFEWWNNSGTLLVHLLVFRLAFMSVLSVHIFFWVISLFVFVIVLFFRFYLVIEICTNAVILRVVLFKHQ